MMYAISSIATIEGANLRGDVAGAHAVGSLCKGQMGSCRRGRGTTMNSQDQSTKIGAVRWRSDSAVRW